MLVKYNRTNVHTAYLDVRGPDSKAILAGKRIRFMPGVNDVKDEDWAKLKQDPEFQAFLDGPEKVMEEMTPDLLVEKGKAKPAADDLSGFTEKKAKTLVEATVDRDLLKAWLDKETRSPVKRALEEQIQKLEKAA